jgi:hypothetical protein
MRIKVPFKYVRVQKYKYKRTKWTGGSGPELHKAGFETVLSVLKGTRYFYER